jgi:hypothetical protein
MARPRNTEATVMHIRPDQTAKTPFICAYLQLKPDSTLSYVLAAGPKSMLVDRPPLYRFDSKDRVWIAALKPVPWIWRTDILTFLSNSPNSDGIKVLGYMDFSRYEITSDMVLAYSDLYYPRKNLGIGLASKLPYFLEMLVVKHMKTLGFTDIAAGVASELRRNQLGAINLRCGPPVAIDEWLLGLGRGIKLAQKNPCRRMIGSQTSFTWSR